RLSAVPGVLAGSLGMLRPAGIGAGGEPGRKFGVYEPIHGSAPDIAGQGVANPCGALLSLAMLLRTSLGREAEAAAVEAAVDTVLNDGARTRDIAAGATAVP